MPPRPPRLIVFDLDGTLVDSRADLARAANALIVELGGTPLDERTLAGMIGDGVVSFVQRALAAGCGVADAGDELVGRFHDHYGCHLLETTLPYPGVRGALGRLQRAAPLAVLTNKPREAAIRLLDGLRLLSHFAEVVADDGRWPLKPDPAGLRHLLRLAEADGDDCLLVGDSLVDWRTARRAGCAIALARYGFGYESFPLAQLRGDELLLDSLDELPAFLGL